MVHRRKFRVRNAKEEEAEHLSNLALRSKAIWGYSQEFIEACRPHIYVDSSYIQNWPVRVLELENQIIGFYSLKTIGEEPRLDNLWIEPEHIQSGFGRILFRDSVLVANKLGWEFFRLAGEPDAVAFYEKMGAVLIGEVQSRLRQDLFLPHMQMNL